MYRTLSASLEPRIDAAAVEVAKTWQASDGTICYEFLHANRAFLANDGRVLR